MSSFSADRYIKVRWEGKTNGGSAVDANLAVGDWIMTKTNATGTTAYYQDTEGNYFCRCVQPDTSSSAHCFARKFVVAKFDDDVNTIPSSAAPTQRKGGFVWVYNPSHPDNQVVYAKVTGSLSVGGALTVGDESFAAATLTLDASAIVGARVGTMMEANSSGTNLKLVQLHPQ